MAMHWEHAKLFFKLILSIFSLLIIYKFVNLLFQEQPRQHFSIFSRRNIRNTDVLNSDATEAWDSDADLDIKCSMANCFNYSKCLNTNDIRIYVYPPSNSPQSSLYRNVLRIITESPYFTNDPNKACIFILSIDTTDRDRISENYIKEIDSYINALPNDLWNTGLNHLIFNFYFGTYPDYAETNLGFDTGKSMIAWTSASRQNFRHDFDLSIPLFHKKHFLYQNKNAIKMEFPGHDQYLASFKGKRYVYGIGSETRDILHHLHNNKSMIIATTCRHNTDWKKFEDERCVFDNVEYDRWNYDELMANSTFCLVPRGRRLGSFRFLESLRATCIPVVLSDDWVLPFDEVIDWAEAIVHGNEKNTLFIYDSLTRIPADRIFRMRQFIQILYQNYFSSVERIVLTTLEILIERIKRYQGISTNKNFICLSP